ncbi:MAG: hypothetical protein GF364_04225, partial [Candidatus Lokiarchaeota archaeon]|nr:hypothetical protein [Candidatus Lokiarchaeota archaeon]
MNSKERVFCALKHIIPDRIPIDIGGLQSGIHIDAYKKLLKHLNIHEKEIKFSDIIQHTALPCEELLESFHADIRYLYFNGTIIPEDAEFELSDDQKWQGIKDQFGVFWGERIEKSKEDILYLDPVIHPLANCKSVEDVRNYDWPDGRNKAPFEGLKAKAKRLRK